MASAKNVVSSNYNTRRKSLSLPSLGINLPVSHASRNARSRTPSISPKSEHPPTKKRQRTHDGETKSSGSMSPPPKRQATATKVYEHTPPPSPKAQLYEDESGNSTEIDIDNINDDIVHAVILYLQKTGNKPIIVKQLAELLQQSVKVVEQSANQTAIVSSRLSSYMKRPCWTTANPCPLAKELETVHPRRIHFYLTTMPHQPIPDPTMTPTTSMFQSHSPPLSSTHSRTDSMDYESRRRELSPSPDVDLSVHELSHEEDVDISDEKLLVAPPTPTGGFSGRLVSTHMDGATDSRAVSPTLDRCEKEFQQTASISTQLRVAEGKGNSRPVVNEVSVEPSRGLEMDGARGDDYWSHVTATPAKISNNTPAIKAVALSPASSLNSNKTSSVNQSSRNDSHSMLWEPNAVFINLSNNDDTDWDMRSPEKVDLDELDGMFADF